MTRNCAAPIEKRKEPLWLRALVQLHNVNLILLSSFMSTSAAYNAWKLGYRFWGSGYSPAEVDMGRTVYIFYISKLYEFMDTVQPLCSALHVCMPTECRSSRNLRCMGLGEQVIMLLKGNLKQVSLLHVYHHVSISCIWCASGIGYCPCHQRLLLLVLTQHAASAGGSLPTWHRAATVCSALPVHHTDPILSCARAWLGCACIPGDAAVRAVRQM